MEKHLYCPVPAVMVLTFFIYVGESSSYLYCCFSALVIAVTLRGPVANNTEVRNTARAAPFNAIACALYNQLEFDAMYDR